MAGTWHRHGWHLPIRWRLQDARGELEGLQRLRRWPGAPGAPGAAAGWAGARGHGEGR
jgi:hypothetical protein